MAALSRILFPTDFSPEAQNALQHALMLAGIQDGEVIVQHVVGSYFEKHPHWVTLFDIHELQKHLDGYAEAEMARILPTDDNKISFRSVISKGRPAEQITELAEREKVDLIVMGPTKGAVTGDVIRASGRPVFSVPVRNGSVPLGKLSRILVATDFSDNSKKVVRYAFELKQLLDCRLDLLHVMELGNAIRFGIRQGHFRDAPGKMRAWADHQLENLTPHQFVFDPSVRRLVEEGPAADTIVRMAGDTDADLVVMGAHGHSAIGKLVVGTTTGKVMSRAQRPLLTLRI